MNCPAIGIRLIGHTSAAYTTAYTNSQELHQTGAFPLESLARWMHDPCFVGSHRFGVGGGVRRAELVGAAHLELVSGVVHLRPEDVVLKAMLSGWRAQQTARGLREDTIVPRERLVCRVR